MDVIIFGTGSLGRLACYALMHDSPHRVVGFTVHGAYMNTTTCMGLPVVAFEDVARTFPPESCAMIAPLGWAEMNGLRRGVVDDGTRMGYEFISWVSSKAVVWPDLRIGRNCMIFEGCIVQPFAEIGDNCVLRAGANVSHDVIVEEDCLLACDVVIGGCARIGARSVLGLNSTVRDHRSIAPATFVAAGAVVTRDIVEAGVYGGVPARRLAMSVADASRGG